MTEKLFKEYINHFEDKVIDVDILPKKGSNISLRGKLHLGGNKIPHLSVNNHFDVLQIKEKKRIICKCEDYFYLLVDCKFDGFGLTSRYILRSNTVPIDRTKKVYVLFKGFSEWVIGSKRVEWSDDKLSFQYKRAGQKFEIDIAIKDGEQFSIKNEYWLSSSDPTAGISVREYSLIALEKCSGHWTTNQVANIIKDIRRVLSLISGLPIQIQYILEENAKSIYFMSGAEPKLSKDPHVECLYRASYLFQENRFSHIFNYYFTINKNKFDDLWSRMHGLLEYRGFWEYKILAAVSFLDKIATEQSKLDELSLTEKKLSRLRKGLRKTVEELYINVPGATDKENAVYHSINSQFSTELKNTNLFSFESKYYNLVNKIDKNVIDIINISNKSFSHLKKIRNLIAHGESTASLIGNDATYEMILVNKIVLLLLYLAHRDLGLSEMDFLSMLDSSRSNLVYGSMLDRAALGARLKTSWILNVKKTVFDRARIDKSDNLVFKYVKASNTYSLDSILTKKLSGSSFDISKKKNSKSIEERVSMLVSSQKIKSITYVGSAAIEYDGKMRMISRSVVLLNAPDNPSMRESVVNRTIKYDAIKNAWISATDVAV